ncbi:MAG TPA: amino acid permease [Bacteroidia bacterium]|jgi:APA family basic amino acid/polyamine antiporter|nr:amino acid permease [Bacteroidia bacterium]
MEDTTHLKQSLSLFDATMIVAGSMIGSGIFIVSADMSRQLGSPGYLLLAWVVSAVITLMAALSYGELAGMMPKAGGQYVYLKEAYGPRLGFMYGWTVFAVIQTGTIAAVAVAFAKYTAVFIPAVSTTNILLDLGFLKISAGQVLAIAIIVIITYINSKGVQTGKMLQGIFTSTKIIALLLLIIVGLLVAFNGHFIHENFQNMWQASATTDKGTFPLSGFTLLGALGVAMVGSLFSSDAWNNVTFISAEIKKPGRNIPLSLLIGTLIVGVLYILANITYLCILPLHGTPGGTDVMHQGIQFAKDERVATAAVSIILGNAATYVMAALIIISTFGCNNGIILSGARLYYAMAQDGLFFKQATQLNKKGVPGKSLIFQCIWACALCLSGKYNELLNYVIIASLLFYIFTIAGIFILRKKQPDAERPYKVFAYPILPALYILTASAICIDLLIDKSTQNDTWPGIIIVLLGIPIYEIVKRKRQA